MKKIIKLSDYDAELNTDVADAFTNMDLTLTLRLGFRQINPAGGAAKGTHNDYGDATEPARKTVKWTPGSWAQWKKNFADTAQKFWHGKFWLENGTSLFMLKDKEGYFVPNVYCRMKIVAQDATAADNHHTIDVVRLDSSENFFGSHSTLYDSLDINPVWKGTDSKGKKIMQRAHVHEVGHLMGLGHVDEGKAHCPTSGDTNATACYGVADIDKYSVMGKGMQLRKAHAKPWQKAMKTFAFTEAFSTMTGPPMDAKAYIGLATGLRASLHGWDASMSRIYPRTPDEVTKGIKHTSRPVRA